MKREDGKRNQHKERDEDMTNEGKQNKNKKGEER